MVKVDGTLTKGLAMSTKRERLGKPGRPLRKKIGAWRVSLSKDQISALESLNSNQVMVLQALHDDLSIDKLCARLGVYIRNCEARISGIIEEICKVLHCEGDESERIELAVAQYAAYGRVMKKRFRSSKKAADAREEAMRDPETIAARLDGLEDETHLTVARCIAENVSIQVALGTNTSGAAEYEKALLRALGIRSACGKSETHQLIAQAYSIAQKQRQTPTPQPHGVDFAQASG